MNTTKEQLLSQVKGEWIKINPLRDIKQVKNITESLKKHSEDFVFNENNTAFLRRKLCLFDNKDEPGYKIVKRGRYEDLYFNDKLIGIR